MPLNKESALKSPPVSPGNVILSSFAVCDSSGSSWRASVQSVDDNTSAHDSRQFPMWKKCSITVSYTGLCVFVQINSSIYGSVSLEIARQFGVTIENAGNSLSIFMFGMGIGALICGPLTELHGRKNVVCYPSFFSGVITCFTFFVSHNFSLFSASRFFQGLLGSPALLIGGSVIRDLFPDNQRAYALLVISVLIGSVPSIGGLLAKSMLEKHRMSSINEVALLFGMFSIIIGLLALGLVQETYVPVINKRLQRSAMERIAHKENESQSAPAPAPSTDHEPNAYLKLLWSKMSLPLRFLSDPIIMVMAILSSFYSASMYLYVTNLPASISKIHTENGISNAQGVSPTETIGFGFTIGVTTFGSSILFAYSYIYSTQSLKFKNVSPELKLIPSLIGALSTITSNFLVFQNDPKFTNINMLCVAEILHGAGFFLAQQSIFLYIMELYGDNSASACSLISVFRNLLSGLLPLLGSNLILRWQNFAFLFLGIVSIASLIVIISMLCFAFTLRKRLKHCAIKTKYQSIGD